MIFAIACDSRPGSLKSVCAALAIFMISSTAVSPRSPAVATSWSTKASADRASSLLPPIDTSPGG
eukprot:8747591-Alexandrium_andersonii.AAC.1